MLWKKTLFFKKDYFNLNYFNEKQWKNGDKTIKEAKNTLAGKQTF